ncbi:MAG: Hint domain-containing protein [Hyphomicrobiaceae bacterium]|nr:Hint domain-containing protein [Hyphomicrobiaceae bacterium]
MTTSYFEVSIPSLDTPSGAEIIVDGNELRITIDGVSRSIEIPGIGSLGIDPNRTDLFHTYNVETKVDGLTTQHLSALYSNLREEPAWFDTLFEAHPYSNGDVGFVPVALGFVSHWFDDQSMTAVNVTIPNMHTLHPGIVVRSVISRGDEVFIKTVGIGNGFAPNTNEKLASAFWPFMDLYIARETLDEFDLLVMPDIVAPCFSAGTPILLADGSSCTIEDIRPRDMIAAFDERADLGRAALLASPVSRLLHGITTEWIVTEDGTRVTPNHRYWTELGSWITAAELIASDIRAVAADGSLVALRGTRLRATDADADATWIEPESQFAGNVLVRRAASTIHTPKAAGAGHDLSRHARIA